MKIVGKGIHKIDGMSIATGKPVYTDDLAAKDALVVKILRSPHAYAKVKNIDTSRALMVDGVECVLTYKDVPNNRFTLAGQSYPEPSPYDRLILEDTVRYVGDEVAIIAAIDEKTAVKAMKMIKVEYEVLKPIIDMEDAIDNEMLVHDEERHCNFDIGMERERNIVSKHLYEKGNIEEELEKCDVVIEETYYTQAQAHAMMETYRAYNYLDHTGRLVVVSSTQIPFHVRRHLSRALNIPSSKIRVIKPRIGGGFGGKQTACVEIFSAIVTLKTGKPAKIIYDRKETFNCSTSRHAMKLDVKIGATKDGIIKVIDIDALSDTGAYGEHASTTFGLVGEKTMPMYNKLTASRFKGNVVYTNKMPAGALRGYGATQGCFAVESTINMLAHKLNIDPTEIRLKNIVKEGETSFAYDKTLNSVDLVKCINKGKELIKWDEKYPSKKLENGKVRSVGMGLTMQGSGIAGIDTASVEIKLNDDGNYTLMVGSTDMGTGSDTILAQMACEILETTMDKITVISADTDVVPYDPGSYASSTTYVTGMAVVKASNILRDKIIDIGAKRLGIDKEYTEFDGEYVYSEHNRISVFDIAVDFTVGPEKEQLVGYASHGSEVSPPPFIAGFVETEMDLETGKYEVIDYVAVVDCGTVINKNLAKIQVEGGIVQGIGMAMFEEVRHTDDGHMDTNTFMQYKIPARCDVGNVIVDFVETNEPTGPFGAKSVGEVVINTPLPAIQESVYNACGVRVNTLPITPEKVFMEMNK
ncbi:molybdopterin-binding domain of aldehyde dehydrogenase family protein [[Clostridium] bifermentans ATCC 638]|uniref:Molybdopterin-binding domain of aldehyde dehydrogenase family protein n=1 Tax=Paraclostridium bifermentans ATCC 638 = DSM 14991 TaxID=1233171 RepID=T4VPF0_PARBF|nr:molybdopterin cofactor-binding domain-containing protein [Paraclostridium bifermentans]EQK43010.1 molybdopterin-binding domain of aldehyde dehydrogenase family protein [[Clostridium] bifermentans ATCC 638] [Paraclostridium bifermentans ATCC 638 = DSM 14991]RIZ60642.1 aldehyde oxidase [Paraclostridium bifermentans]UAG19691.1 molybdopterin-dependent oxidoreductase [Paraclostridium bifermentans]